MRGRFDEQGRLIFEFEIFASDGTGIFLDAILDTGFTGWLAIDRRDAESIGWLKMDDRVLLMASGEAMFDVYVETVRLAELEVRVEAFGGDNLPETLIGLAWLETLRLVADFPANILTLGE